MHGIIRRKCFFLTDKELAGILPFSVNLEKYASELLQTRSDFTISDLLNYAFTKEHDRQKQWQQNMS